jgi:hypothetical protein
MSEFKFEIGKKYKTRGMNGAPWAKLIGEGAKRLAFEFPDNSVGVRTKDGRVFYNILDAADVLLEEYLEPVKPVKYERFIWAEKVPGNDAGGTFFSHVFGHALFTWNFRKTESCSRKYKITVEEIEE